MKREWKRLERDWITPAILVHNQKRGFVSLCWFDLRAEPSGGNNTDE